LQKFHFGFCALLAILANEKRPKGNQLKANEISNFSQNEIESKRAEFKTSAVINKNFKLLKYKRMTDFFVCFSLSKKWQKKRRTTNKLLAAEILRNSRDTRFMRAASGGHACFQKIKKFAIARKFE